MNFLTRICIDRPALGWFAVMLIGLPPLLGHIGFRMAEPVPAGWVPAHVIEELNEQQRIFKSNTSLILVLQCPDFFRPERIAALHETVAELRALPGIFSVTWAGDIPEVTLLGRRRPLLPDGDNVTAAELKQARTELLSQPLIADNLMSSDGRTLLLLIDSSETAAGAPKPKDFVSSIRNLARGNLQDTGISVQATGIEALYDVQQKALTEDNLRIQMMAYAVVAFLLIAIFRRPAAIILAGAGPVTGVFWTMGWLKLTGQANNELAKIILPVLVMMIGFTDGVHLILRLRQLRSSGNPLKESLRTSMLQTGPACFLTSLTTAVGFGSLMFSQSELISGFGMNSAIGVIVTFLAVIIVSPLLAVSRLGEWMYVPPAGEPVTMLVSRFSSVISFSARHAASVSIVGVVVTIAGLVACANLVPDDRVSDRIPENSEAWRAMRHCDEHVGGIRNVNLMIQWDGEQSRKAIWAVVRRCETLLDQEDQLGQPLSIRTALTVIRGRYRPDQSILANQLPDDFKERFYRPDDHTASVMARTQDFGFAAFGPMFQRINDGLAKIASEHPGFRVELVSDVILECHVVSQMIREMLYSLAGAAVIIFAILAIAFRSLRLGMISIVPNVMPLVVAGSVKYVVDGSIGIAGTCSLAICLGIAVDDTIHYLHHFRHERRNGADPLTANRRTFIAVGSALFLTTVVMTTGLSTVMTSQVPPQVNFASMALITLLVALPADLLFLPSLLTLFTEKSDRVAEGSRDKLGPDVAGSNVAKELATDGAR